MGNNAYIFCMTCDVKEHLCRATVFKEELLNQKLDIDKFKYAQIILAKADSALEKVLTTIDFFSLQLDFVDTALSFAEMHKEHELWLIDEYTDIEQIKIEVKKE